jgi:parvulin-like peptidyl-prolyl isomerase
MGTMKFRAALALALGIAAFAAGCGGSDSSSTAAPAIEVPADAIAVVAGTPVTRAEFQKLMDRAKAAYEAQQKEFPAAGTPEYESLKNDAVELLVNRIEFAREAEALGITVTETDVTKRLDELKQQFYAKEDGTIDEEKYKQELEASQLTEEDLRAQLKATLISEKLSEELTKDLTVTDAEMKKYYDDNPDRFTTPESREVAHILVDSEDKANELYAQLQDGADFAKLAKENSTDTGSAENGGKLTDVKGSFVPEFEEVAFALKTDEIGKPVKSQFGWHIIKALADTKPESVTPFADVKDSIRDQLLQEKGATATSDWVAQIDAKYAPLIAYAAGFAPPAETATTTDTGSTVTGSTVTTATSP